MDITPTLPPTRLDSCDAALLLAFAVVTAIGTWQCCLLVNDGAVFLAAGWLGNVWDLSLSQNPPRAVSLLAMFGPAWALRSALDLSAETYVVVAHLLYFAVPLLLWLAIRGVEPHPAFARLYLCLAMALVFFPSEVIVAMGLWLIWAAIVARPGRSLAFAVLATVGFAAPISFTHALTALLSLLYLLAGGLLAATGRPFPRHALVAAAIMTVLLLGAFFLADAWQAGGNPTGNAWLEKSRYTYLDLGEMLATVILYPVLIALWLLLLAPGFGAAVAHRRLSSILVLAIGALGLWFAANGVDVVTWIFARRTGPYVLVVSLVLALALPAAQWLAAARRPFMLFAGVMAMASLSYGLDLALFDRAVEARLAPLVERAETPPAFADIAGPGTMPWQSRPVPRPLLRGYFKWMAVDDYVRDLVIPDYGGERMTIAFYSYFRSNRRAVLYRTLDNEWVPFECAPVVRALADARDDIDRRFLRFLSEQYCVR
jgi:hypothetical protein